MNKNIGIWIGIAAIIILAVIVGIFMMKTKAPEQKSVQPSTQNTNTNTQPAAGEKTKDQACLNSGGSIETGICCKSTSDFPNSCLIGGCGCAPANSREIKICNCGAGKCFDGNACVGR